MLVRELKMVSVLLFCAAMPTYAGCSACGTKKCSTTQAQSPCPPNSPCAESLVGPAGRDGPTGPTGERGLTGQTGAPGYAVAGPRGEQGGSGPMGQQGPAGATGAAGSFERGPAGVAGPAGPEGAQGATGQTGQRGASAEGYAGSTGPSGVAGAQGAAGPTGVRGPTTIGPAGPAGRPGQAGAQGATGETGARGVTTAGVSGATGPSGLAGTQGPAGPTGSQGPAGIVACWTSYREFWFDYDRADLHTADGGKVSEIVAYMKQNPSLIIGIDGSMDPNGSDSRDQDLSDRRVNAVRDELIQAGLSNERIKIGAFGDRQLRRDRRVEVLFVTNDLWLSGAMPHYGKIISITGNSLVMTDTLGRNEHTCTLAGNAVVIRDGKVSRAMDLKPGMKIRVTTSQNNPHSANRIEALDQNWDFKEVG